MVVQKSSQESEGGWEKICNHDRDNSIKSKLNILSPIPTVNTFYSNMHKNWMSSASTVLRITDIIYNYFSNTFSHILEV